MILQDRLVVMTDSKWGLHLDQENIVDTWMFKVVNAGCSQQGKVFKLIKFSFFSQLPMRKEVIYCLTQICAVGLIVIGDVFIASLNFGRVIDQLMYIQFYFCEHTTSG